MAFQDAYRAWWADPSVVVVPDGDPKSAIEWLKHQSTDDWHAIATTWNYDYGTEVLAWILTQQACDRGTAAHVFVVEAQGHWLGEMNKADPNARRADHVCNIVLSNWSNYRTAELKCAIEPSAHTMSLVDHLLTPILNENGEEGAIIENTSLRDIVEYRGLRDAVSDYVTEDGVIKLSVDAWARKNGIHLTHL